VHKQNRRRKVDVVHQCSKSANIEIKAAGVPSEPRRTLAGAVVRDLEIFLRRELALPSDLEGVVVHYVAENSPAYKAGLRSGDVITEVNCTSVLTADHAFAMADASKDPRILLQVWTEKGLRHLTIYKS
jgi:S1-C subfamily serine protease